MLLNSVELLLLGKKFCVMLWSYGLIIKMGAIVMNSSLLHLKRQAMSDLRPTDAAGQSKRVVLHFATGPSNA